MARNQQPQTSVRALGRREDGEHSRPTLRGAPRREIKRREPIVDKAAGFGDNGYTHVPKGFKPQKTGGSKRREPRKEDQRSDGSYSFDRPHHLDRGHLEERAARGLPYGAVKLTRRKDYFS